MTIFYNFAFFIFSIIYLPRFLLKIRHEPDRPRLLRERLGILPASWRQKFHGKTTLWLHAVSVGEVMAVRKFLEEILQAEPEVQMVLTTVTPTGQEVARRLAGRRVNVCYFPFDVTGAVKNFLQTLQPRCVILAETEIWPNLLSEARRVQVPVGIVNARLSPKSYRRYRRFLFLFRPLFQHLDFVLAQTEADGERFAELGVRTERIHILGNMKFDHASEPLEHPAASVQSLRQEWNLKPSDEVWIAGSTHPGEEEKLLAAFRKLRERFESLKLILAPRHIERSQGLKRKIVKLGWKAGLVSERNETSDFDILLLDKLGILKHLYTLADVVFMGGSLVPHGGQNPIEPAGFRKAVLHGPHVFNFEKVYQVLDEEGGALVVRDTEQLAFALGRLLEDENERRQLGENAFRAIQKLKGATRRHLEWIRDFLAPHTQERKLWDVEFDEKLFPAPGGRT